MTDTIDAASIVEPSADPTAPDPTAPDPTAPDPTASGAGGSLHRTGPAAAVLAGAGVLFIVAPWLGLGGNQLGAESLSGWASPAWLAAQLTLIVALVGVAIGLLGLRDALAGYLGGRLAAVALPAWWIGAALVISYLGAQAFALNALGRWVDRTRQFELLGLAQAVRTGAVPMAVFALGSVLIAGAAVLTALAVLRSQVMPPGAGLLLAIAFLTFWPQTHAPTWVRIVHGVLAGLGCLVLALRLRRLSSS